MALILSRPPRWLFSISVFSFLPTESDEFRPALPLRHWSSMIPVCTLRVCFRMQQKSAWFVLEKPQKYFVRSPLVAKCPGAPQTEQNSRTGRGNLYYQQHQLEYQGAGPRFSFIFGCNVDHPLNVQTADVLGASCVNDSHLLLFTSEEHLLGKEEPTRCSAGKCLRCSLSTSLRSPSNSLCFPCSSLERVTRQLYDHQLLQVSTAEQGKTHGPSTTMLSSCGDTSVSLELVKR